MFKRLKQFFHVHRYSDPILSKYVSFSCRDIIWQCKCGKRISIREWRLFDSPFSKETDIHVTIKYYEEVLHGKSDVK